LNVSTALNKKESEDEITTLEDCKKKIEELKSKLTELENNLIQKI
jgi:hypothetical protein